MTLIKKIGFLTSSRADYGISTPLIRALNIDKRFDLTVIAFGMHLEKKFGFTINEIKSDKSLNIKEIKYMPQGHKPKNISSGQAKVMIEFAKFWSENSFDTVIAIGDRFEMFAAVQSSVPFEVKLIHIHGGETSLGSIDNIYRDQISIASSIHFTSNAFHSLKVQKLSGKKEMIFDIGSLSLHELDKLKIPKWSDVCKKFNIINKPFVLVTFHPETIDAQNNHSHINVIKTVLTEICSKVNLVITLSNADTYGNLYNKLMNELSSNNPDNIFLVNSFGKLNYFSALKSCQLVLGNSSSGLIEAASFNKYTLNVGNRQLGRVRNKNVIDVKFDSSKILQKLNQLLIDNFYSGDNIYSTKMNLKDINNIIYEF